MIALLAALLLASPLERPAELRRCVTSYSTRGDGVIWFDWRADCEGAPECVGRCVPIRVPLATWSDPA